VAERPSTIVSKQLEKLTGIFEAIDAAASELANEEKLTPLEKKAIEGAIAKMEELRNRLNDNRAVVEERATQLTAITERFEEVVLSIESTLAELEGIENSAS
jgi:chromosome segregation ATPase